MENVNKLVERSVAIHTKGNQVSKKSDTNFMSLIREIQSTENSTARKAGETAILVIYFLSGLAVVEALCCLGNWVWSEIKRGVHNHKRTQELKSVLVNDIVSKAKKAFLPLANNILTQLMSRRKVIETIAYVKSIPVIAGKAAINNIMKGKAFNDAKKAAIDSAMKTLGETKNGIFKDLNVVLGISEAPTVKASPVDKDKPVAKNPALENIKKIIFDELDTIVMQPVKAIFNTALFGPSKEDPTPGKPTVTTKVTDPETEDTPELESGGAQMELWLRELIKGAISNDTAKQAPVAPKMPAAPTVGVLPEVKAMTDDFKNQVGGEFLGKLLIRYDLDPDVLPEDESSITPHLTAIAKAAAAKKAMSYLPTPSRVSAVAVPLIAAAAKKAKGYLPSSSDVSAVAASLFQGYGATVR
jgi:hypothetical protein